MDNIGLVRGTVQLVPHDDNWHKLFLNEARLLQSQLSVDTSDIQHIGSTAVPGIYAKPIIDIAILVHALDVAETWVKPLAEIGYWNKGKEATMPYRRFFAKGPDSLRTVYLHVVNEEEFKRLITFRDTLRANNALASQYSELKLKLAKNNVGDRANYTKLKNDFIKKILAI